MTDVSVYVALISAGSALIGTAIPLVVTAFRESGQAKRDRQERGAQQRRDASMELLRAAGDFRARIADLYDHHGEDMDERMADVRRSEANVSLCAASVALLPPGTLADPANAVATAAHVLVTAAEENPGLSLGAMTGKPAFQPYDDSVVAFRKDAVAEARG
jgi:hypothetical protein